jgi:hypothetical protein
MTAENFVYWLQGYLELSEGNFLSPKQVKIVKDHIGLVLKKVTPEYEPMLKRGVISTRGFTGTPVAGC